METTSSPPIVRPLIADCTTEQPLLIHTAKEEALCVFFWSPAAAWYSPDVRDPGL